MRPKIGLVMYTISLSWSCIFDVVKTVLSCSDVVLKTRVLVCRCLEDKNERLGLGLDEKVLQFFKTFIVIDDGSDQGTQ